MSETKPEIRYTENLTVFRPATNRPTDLARAAKIAEEIRQGRNLLGAFPIVVNENMEIVDGGHRHAAAEMAGVGLYYIVVPGLTFMDQAAANRLTKSWTMSDWAHVWASRSDCPNRHHYVKLLALCADFPTVGLKTLIDYTQYGRWNRPTLNERFRAGLYECLFEQEARRLAAIHADFRGRGLPNDNALSGAVVRLYRNQDYDHKRMVAAMDRNPGLIQSRHTSGDYLLLFQDVYNRGRPAEKRVALAPL